MPTNNEKSETENGASQPNLNLPPNTRPEDVIKGVNPKQMQFTRYNGMMVMTLFESPDVHFPKVKAMPIRDDDVFLVSYPKSGTHWTFRILDMIMRGKADYEDGRKPYGTILDFVPTEVTAQSQSPRLLLTHLPADLWPEEVKDGRIKLVHVYRHPKAVVNSLYHQMMGLKKIPDLTMTKLEMMINNNQAPYNSMFHFFDKLNEYQKANPKVSIYNIAYEDLKKDTFGSIKKLAEYLERPMADDLCNDITTAVSFSNQKKAEEAKDEKASELKMYRKGETDDWKNLFTVAQSERMDQCLQDRASACTFSRRYAPTS